jgi:hypothetical protein
MLTMVKSLFLSACLLSVMVAASIDARAADIPLRKALATPSQESEVISRREPRTLSRREIFQAIQNDLAQMGISERGELRPGDLNIQSSVPVLRDDMGLQVKRIGFDPIRRETVFELWASHEPQYLPFEVTTRRDPQTLGLASHIAWNPGEAGGGFQTENPTAGQGMSRARSKAPVLAKSGKPATLVMLGENVRITTTVIPLQPGIRGQRILVRELTTARVMSAEVVDEGLLRTSF